MVAETLNAASATRSPRRSTTCVKCGAWKGELGLEPTPELFVDHLADVFDEVRRVLRSDGTLWLNLGDTYCTHPAGLTGARRWKTSTLEMRDHTGAEQAGSIDKRTPGPEGEGSDRDPMEGCLRTPTPRLVAPDGLHLGEEESDAGTCSRPSDPVARVCLPAREVAAILLRRRGGTGTTPRELAPEASPSRSEPEGQPEVQVQASSG